MTFPSLQALHQEIILAHHRRPRNRTELADPDASVHMSNPTCGDRITLYLRGRDGCIVEVGAVSHGCAISQASASMMTELIRGRTLAEVGALAVRFRAMLHGSAEAAKDNSLGDLRALSGVAKFPTRVRCALLPWNALDEALRDLGPR